jgi:hypothetical protein
MNLDFTGQVALADKHGVAGLTKTAALEYSAGTLLTVDGGWTAG